jgi:hypothetical protein
MACTHRFLNFTWEHHAWRPHVTFAETMETRENNMWGRTERVHYVRCQKQDVCETCGKTRENVTCLCDCDYGDTCAPRLEWLEKSRHEAE